MSVVLSSCPYLPPIYCVNETHPYKVNGDFKISKNLKLPIRTVPIKPNFFLVQTNLFVALRKKAHFFYLGKDANFPWIFKVAKTGDLKTHDPVIRFVELGS